nr:hypothetical protein [Tanacetum cinerariifolium]
MRLRLQSLQKISMDYTSAITPDEPVLSTEEPANSLSMGDEHLDTIPATKSDEFIKSGVENLIPIPNQFENFSESNKEFSLIDDDSFSIDDIDCVEASPSDSELTKSSFTSLNSLLEETNTFDNSFPEFESFCFDVEEISSGSTTTYLDISLPKYEAFYDDHVKEISSGNPTTHSDSPSLCFVHVEPNSRDFTKDVVEDISPTKEPQVLNTLTTHPSLQLNMKFQPSSESLFTYVVKENPKKDKIRSKPDKNRKRGEAEKSQKQLQWIEEEKLNKTQKERPEMQTYSSFKRKKKRRGLKVHFNESSSRRTYAAIE